jgi:uncharacterized phage-associated protein
MRGGAKGGQTVSINHSREKLINVIVFFLRKTKYCGKTKLFKLLFLLDFMHFKQTGRPVTGLRYFAWRMGPVPRDLFEELDCPKEDLCQHIFIPGSKEPKEFLEMKPRKKFNDLHFSDRELRLMGRLAEIFRDAKAEHMIDVTHLPNMPWDKTLKDKGEFAEIDYLLALDNTKESLTLQEALERIRDAKEVSELKRQ